MVQSQHEDFFHCSKCLVDAVLGKVMNGSRLFALDYGKATRRDPELAYLPSYLRLRQRTFQAALRDFLQRYKAQTVWSTSFACLSRFTSACATFAFA